MTDEPPDTQRSVRGSSARVAAFRAGVYAETFAAWFLMLKGYRVLARRHRTPQGEIDLVMRRGRTIAFVEVKSRPSLDDAAYSVTPRQQMRIVNAARAWLMRHPKHASLDLRFDVVLVSSRHLPRHIPAAFQAAY